MSQSSARRQNHAPVLRCAGANASWGAMEEHPATLGDPEIAAQAWARLRRIIRLMLAVVVILVFGAFLGLYRHPGEDSAHIYVATALGIGITTLLVTGLLGLVFLSSRSRCDQNQADSPDDQAGP
jgi:hypothetical protein